MSTDERMRLAVDRQTQSITRLADLVERLAESVNAAVLSIDEATQAMAGFGQASADAGASAEPEPPTLSPDAVVSMIDRVRTLFNTDGIEDIFPPSLPGLLRAGGQVAEIEAAVEALTESGFLISRDGLLYKV